MPATHFDSLFTFATAGLGLLLASGLNLAFGSGRGGRGVWLRLVFTLVLCGAVLGGLMALTPPELALRAARVLVGVLLVAVLLSSEWCTRQLASLVTFFRKPARCWGLVALGGLGLIVGSGIAFDRADDEVTNQTVRNLELLTGGHTPSQPTNRAHATTDLGNQIILYEPISPRDPNELAESEGMTLWQKNYGEQVIRRSGPSDSSNCHGWVFTDSKFILSPDDVELILKENGYREVQDPQPGDLVIYRKDGAIAHSAVVRYATEGQPVLIEGKWGALGVFLHPTDKSLYGNEYTFRRSARTGHLLVGLGGSPAPHATHSGGSE